jgi:hypothetical protein
MGFRAHSRCSSSLCEHPDLKTQNQKPKPSIPIQGIAITLYLEY